MEGPLLLRGGTRQRRAALDAAGQPSAVTSKSALAEILLFLFGWGLLTATCIQWVAGAAVRDGLNHPDLLKLAAVGAAGEYPGNCRRDLLSKFCNVMRVPKYTTFTVMMKDSKGVVEPRRGLMNAPNRFLDSLYQHCVGTFRKICGALGNGLRDFWTQVSRDDPKLKHLISILGPLESWYDHVIPYKLHGDAATFTHKRDHSMLSAQIKPLLATNETFRHWILLFSIVKTAAVHNDDPTGDTMEVHWAYAVHFLDALFDGRHPQKDPWGRDWPSDSPDARTAGLECCGGMRWVCWAIVGDLDFFSNDLGYPHVNSNHPCWFDSVSRDNDTDFPLTDLSRGAAWKGTLLSEEECMEIPCTRRFIGKLKGTTRYQSPGDLMHTGCLGVVAAFVGAILWELVHDGPFPGTIDQRLGAVCVVINASADIISPTYRVSNLTRSMFEHGDNYASFTGKAAESQHMLFSLLDVCNNLDDGGDHHGHRLAALRSLCGIYKMYKDNGMFLSRAAFVETKDLLDTFYEHYAWLAQDAVNRDRLLYPILPKHHMLYHIVDLGRWLNPTALWCYDAEDFMHVIVTTAKSCVAGSPMYIIGNKVLENALLALDLMLFR
ncbi:unnamed protein product [Prorocentrum cordatum]|uniref:Uncharacterized protein n=1 Tax=Prorocentrum cordatum TaxID=2364126 RepID=A0ABN9RYU0_9DINO|nr:unnamed protein product [Polarella glacialis]